MRRREEKRREFHEALLQTLYPPPPSSPPSPVEVVDDEPFDVTLINPEDYLKIDSSNHGDVNEIGDESGIAEKPSRAKRKRLRKKMLKEEAARRKKVIGPLLPTEMLQTHDGIRVGDAGGSNFEEEDSDGDEEETSGSISDICSEQGKIDDNDKTRKVKKRREAKKLAKESSNIQDGSNP
ncbi:unnamed protein product [Arabidopsis lyrata]|uniref:Uncharacterized protein n=1 Tax=Arabidopsis lyrata subsp. lyrata TaxID=81972 RepID=D7MUN5_ARALL|nr:uncharacterized protein LOC9301063 [Arabidopsis lyrata subsp. lyrata]EFH41247.1 hypothetical protein ARALYDRAFT_332808 [Arabidopsis lyrata subsp. lyrata]CAH8280963.1 unnamed protein product [Arabidopsis lyrata]|eukprot:XP_002864988.1 uncharacterized protein LOC9301063 [Arabidopsis lyrata subsp. lyrata]